MFIRTSSTYACPVLILLQASVYGSSLAGKGRKEGKESYWFLFGVGFFQADKFCGDYKRYLMGEVEKDSLKCPICCRVWDLARQDWPTLLPSQVHEGAVLLLALPVHPLVGSYGCTGALWHRGWMQWERDARTERQQYPLQTRGEELGVSTSVRGSQAWWSGRTLSASQYQAQTLTTTDSNMKSWNFLPKLF